MEFGKIKATKSFSKALFLWKNTFGSLKVDPKGNSPP
jgi:hypothetical protein